MSTRKRQAGAAAVEFAIVSVVFFTLLIGIMEMGRMLFYWNTVTEMTRMGARLAAVCEPDDPDNPQIAARIAAAFPSVPVEGIEVTYSPENCDVQTCELVTVRVVANHPISNVIPFVPASVNSITMPEFRTTIPRESMQNVFQGTPNPVCG
jgi:Flp pilus assembly protein TadG